MSVLINSVIIDDEINSVVTLTKMLETYCKNVNVIGTAPTVREAVDLINITKPELVFLDISLPDGDGFEVLNAVTFRDFQVIFETAHNEYAIRAFEFSALHYLLKPIKYQDLKDAVQRFETSQKEIQLEQKIKILHETLNNQPSRIILPGVDGFAIVQLEQIVRAESENNYTTFYLTNGQVIVVSKPISSYESSLSDISFVRVHSKHLINLAHVKQYVRGRGGTVIMTDDTEIDISEGKKKDFIEKLTRLARQ